MSETVERDPRVEPSPGDILRWNYDNDQTIERAVLAVITLRRGIWVKFKTTFIRSSTSVRFKMPLDRWLNECATAEVISRGPE